MSPEVLAHAMEPFYTARADGTGTGLGLAMVYGFIRQSGGDVQITSTPGQGTTVQLMLPLCRAAGVPLVMGIQRRERGADGVQRYFNSLAVLDAERTEFDARRALAQAIRAEAAHYVALSLATAGGVPVAR